MPGIGYQVSGVRKDIWIQEAHDICRRHPILTPGSLLLTPALQGWKLHRLRSLDPQLFPVELHPSRAGRARIAARVR